MKRNSSYVTLDKLLASDHVSVCRSHEKCRNDDIFLAVLLVEYTKLRHIMERIIIT